MSFIDVIGQETAVRILQDELDSGRINHAYLFLGKDGVGKKTLAFQFAKALNCQEKGEDSCDNCINCRRIDHFNHPDVKLIGVEEGNAIKIDQIRELQRDLAYKPYESTWKIYIIDQADRMTEEAANSLLKTLEEPPEYGIIILLAEELSKLLPTVISRCQQIYLNRLSSDLVKERIFEQVKNEKKARLIARLADGSLGTALNLVNNNEYLLQREKIFDFLSRIMEVERYKILNFASDLKDLLSNDEGNFPLFSLLISWYRDIIMWIEGNEDEIVNNDYLERIKLQADMYTIDELISIVNLIKETKKYIKFNVRKDLSLQVLLLKIRAKRV